LEKGDGIIICLNLSIFLHIVATIVGRHGTMLQSRRCRQPPCHVTSSGHGRYPASHQTARHESSRHCADDEDRGLYRELLLAQSAANCAISAHAYALMSDHVHLLVTPIRAGDLASAMRLLNPQYVWRSTDAIIEPTRFGAAFVHVW
jgi:hypothetical protein